MLTEFIEKTGSLLTGTILIFLSAFFVISIQQSVVYFLMATAIGCVLIYYSQKDDVKPTVKAWTSRGVFYGLSFGFSIVLIMYIIRGIRRGVFLGLFVWGPYLLNAMLFISIAGGIVGMVHGTSKLNEQRAEEANEQLKKQNEQLKMLTNAISHDLRNPLSVAAGNAEIVATKSDKETVAESADAMQTSLERMEQIISDTLSVARAERNMNMEKADLRPIIEDAWSHTDTRDMTLEITGSSQPKTDEGFMSQAFENMFRNTSNHTDATRVHVNLSDEYIEVRDNGEGFDERFTGNADYTNSDYGIGLSVITYVAHEHGWETTLENEDGAIIRFTPRNRDTL